MSVLQAYSNAKLAVNMDILHVSASVSKGKHLVDAEEINQIQTFHHLPSRLQTQCDLAADC